MIALTSRILMILLAVYSYFQIKPNLSQSLPAVPAAMAPKMLFVIQLFVTFLFFIIPFFPESIHFGSRRLSDYSAKQLECVTPLVKDLLSLMGMLMALYFAVNVHLFAGQVNSPDPRAAARSLVALESWLVGALLVGETALIIYYLRRFDSVSAHTPDQPPSDIDLDSFR